MGPKTSQKSLHKLIFGTKQRRSSRGEAALVPRDGEEQPGISSNGNGHDCALNPTPIANRPDKCSHATGGAARIAARREISKSTTFGRADNSVMMQMRISLRFVQIVTEPDIFAADPSGHAPNAPYPTGRTHEIYRISRTRWPRFVRCLNPLRRAFDSVSARSAVSASQSRHQ